MKKMMFYTMALMTVFLMGCATPSAKAPAMMKDGMMVDAKGMTLYTFDKDVVGSGKSVCNGDLKVNHSTPGLRTKSLGTSMAITTTRFGILLSKA
jgi:predicted lipoprotein with Yx(FWY)xxD motif